MELKLGHLEVRHFRGLYDKTLGLGKEAVGTIFDREPLVKQGQAQQARATADLAALRRQTKAQAAEIKAGIKQQTQRAARTIKERAS